MQKQNSKVKTQLKHRAYQYSIRIIEFLDLNSQGEKISFEF